MRERRTSGEFVLDRRRIPRVPLRVDVICSAEGACYSGTTQNLTVHGLFLETETPVPPDTEVEVVLELPGDEEPIKASGRVVRLAQRKHDTPGFAVEFENLAEPARARIAALVDETLADLSSRSA
jgi:uncharacterized protein (TIGR02266 family)